MKKYFSIVFLALISLLIVTQVLAATITTTTQSDFQAGTIPSTLDASTSPGDLRLNANVNTVTETSEADFDEGTTGNNTEVTNSSGGEVTLNSSYSYIDRSTFATTHYLDAPNNLLYIGTVDGVKVVNTQGTVTIDDDSTVFNYTTTSIPPIAENLVVNIFMDTTRNLLYISSNDNISGDGGLSVINTQGTVSPNDDTLVAIYDSNSTPALSTDNVVHTQLDEEHNLLYISNGNQGGLNVVNTQGTVTVADDTLVFTYTIETTPALAGNGVNFSYLDSENDLLYVSSQSFTDAAGGVAVIDTQGTVSPADDTLVTTYDTTTTPPMGGDNPGRIWLDEARNLLYVVTGSFFSGSDGLTVINTLGTESATDDTLVVHYNSSNTPTLIDQTVFDAFLDITTDFLYISLQNGISVIDTQGTVSAGDDTLVTAYSNTSDPIFPDFVYNPFVDTVHNLLYFTSGGIGAILLDGYVSPGVFESQVIDIPSLSDLHFSWSATTPTNTAVSLQTRTGDEETVTENFDGGSVFSDAGNAYSYEPFDTTSEGGGVFTMAGPQDIGGGQIGGYNWFNADKTYPIGAVISARVRVNTNASTVELHLFSDGDDSTELTTVSNDWETISFISDEEFTQIGFRLYADSWDAGNDTVEIDWIAVDVVDWSSWSSSCATSGSCSITAENIANKELLQYRLNLASNDQNITPTVDSVSITYAYQTAGEYISPVFDSGTSGTVWNTLTSDATIPALTALTFSTRTGDTSVPDGSWSAWSVVTSDIIASAPGQYLQYKTLFTSTDEDVSPILRSVTISNNGASTTTNNPINFITEILEKIFSPQVAPIPYLTKPETPSLFVTPAFDSNTSDQKLVTFIQAKTFEFDAYLYSAITKASVFKEKIKNLTSDKGNVKFVGGEYPLLGFTFKSKSYWQVGSVHEVWYKTVRSSENIDPAIIIPELQKYPSIISLSYQPKDLVPPGSPKTLFDVKSLVLAHSLDGYHWQVLESSVVDPEQKTVSAISKVGGFYTIVAKVSSTTSTVTQ